MCGQDKDGHFDALVLDHRRKNFGKQLVEKQPV
jgi:hypothetical protein